jgi:hypothetical protein
MRMSFSFRLHVAAVALLGALAAAPTCGGASESARSLGGQPDGDPAPGSPPPLETNFGDDASTRAPIAFRGNPLCRVGEDDCMPDDDGSRLSSGAEACATADDDSGDPGPAYGCRVTKESGELAPTCSEAFREGTDGASCAGGDECAPGFDCVDGDSGGVCRRYCCVGTCNGHVAQNGGNTFCDLQRLTDTSQRAPVCMPIKSCVLLEPGGCSDTETCAVVTQGGETGCVAIGPRQVGQTCDEAQCAAGLTCLGQPGNRKCYELCKVGTACKSSGTCMTSSTFADPQFGVCQ